MAERRPLHQRVLTLHEWEAKHYVIASTLDMNTTSAR